MDEFSRAKGEAWASQVIERDGKFYSEKICYAMSRSITGPWEYKGILNEIAGNSNTNHQAIIEFKGDWYFIYHYAMNRSITGPWEYEGIDRLYYNEDGTMKRIQMTTEGVQ